MKAKKVMPATKLTAAQIDTLGVLHENDKWHPLELIVTESGLTEAVAKATLKKLVDSGYVLKKEGADSYRYTGLRCKALKLAVGAMRMQGEPLAAGLVGAAIWSDPKVKNDPKADTRYAPAAYAVLKSAFELGAVYRVESDGAPLFGAVA